MRPPLSAIEPDDARRIDAYARRGGERGLARDRLRRLTVLGGGGAGVVPGGAGVPPGCAYPARPAGPAAVAGCVCCCACFCFSICGQAEIDLPADQHERRQHDGDDGVLLIVHLGTRSRRSARLKSSVICSNGSDKAARRPTST